MLQLIARLLLILWLGSVVFLSAYDLGMMVTAPSGASGFANPLPKLLVQFPQIQTLLIPLHLTTTMMDSH